MFWRPRELFTVFHSHLWNERRMLIRIFNRFLATADDATVQLLCLTLGACEAGLVIKFSFEKLLMKLCYYGAILLHLSSRCSEGCKNVFVFKLSKTICEIQACLMFVGYLYFCKWSRITIFSGFQLIGLEDLGVCKPNFNGSLTWPHSTPLQCFISIHSKLFKQFSELWNPCMQMLQKHNLVGWGKKNVLGAF